MGLAFENIYASSSTLHSHFHCSMQLSAKYSLYFYLECLIALSALDQDPMALRIVVLDYRVRTVGVTGWARVVNQSTLPRLRQSFIRRMCPSMSSRMTCADSSLKASLSPAMNPAQSFPSFRSSSTYSPVT